MDAPEGVLEEVPELELNPTANLATKAGRDLWTQTAGAGAEPILELEFDRTLGL